MKSKILFYISLCLCILLLTGCSHFNRRVSADKVSSNDNQTNYAVKDSASMSDPLVQDGNHSTHSSEFADHDETTQTLDERQIESLEAMIAQDEKKLCIYDEMVVEPEEPLNVQDSFTICLNSVETSKSLKDLAAVSVDELSDVFDKSLLDEQGTFIKDGLFVKVLGEVTFHQAVNYNVFQWNLVATSADDDQLIMERPELVYTNLISGDGRYRYYYDFTENQTYEFYALYVVSEDLYNQRHLFFNPGHLSFPKIGEGPTAAHVIRIH